MVYFEGTNILIFCHPIFANFSSSEISQISYINHYFLAFFADISFVVMREMSENCHFFRYFIDL